MSEVIEIVKKICGGCKIEKVAIEENFRFRKGKCTSECKECIKAYNKAHKKVYNQNLKDNPPVKVFPEEKECNECHVVKKLNKDIFTFNNSKVTYDAKCKICFNKLNNEKYEAKLIEQGKTKKVKLGKDITDKTCLQCNVFKNIEEEYYDRFDSLCKKCKCANDKIKRATPEGRAKKAASDRRYLDNNKEKVKLQRKKAREKPKNKIRHLISNSILKALKFRGKRKNGSISDHLPYTDQELADYLESKFEPWMNWDNHGVYRPKTWNDNDSSTWTWNIDHIIPHSRFEYESMEEQSFKDCWAMSNLRPYSAKQNIIDQDRR